MPELEIFSDSFPAFGSTCDLVFTGLQAEDAKKILQKIKIETEQLENIFSHLSFISDVYRLNHSAVDEWITIDPVLTDFLSLCTDFYEMSSGAFNICTGPLYLLWEQKKDPTSGEIKIAREKSNFLNLELDEENHRVRFREKGMQLDLRMIDKAFMADILKNILLENKVTNCILSFDEQVILALGHHPSGEAWPIGVRNFLQPGEFIHVFENSNRFTVNTGTVNLDSSTAKMNDHLVISPESGLPMPDKKTISVSGISATFAAFLAHSWLILEEHDQSIIAEQISDVEILEVDYFDDDLKTKLTLLNREE